MKCVSCQADVDPKWQHAINNNACPWCGQPIMEEHLKNLLSTLGQTMQQLQNYPAQLNDWLLSNYNYIKTDSPDIKDYLPKDILKELQKQQDDTEFQEKKKSVVKIKLPGGGEQEVVVEQLQSAAKTEGFFERASSMLPPPDKDDKDAPKSVGEKTQHLKAVARQIRKEVASGLSGSSMLSPEMMQDADPEAVAELKAALDGGEMVVSALPGGGDEDSAATDRILAANMALANKKGGKGSGANAADLQALNNMYGNIQKSKDVFESGENRGKGGFSRSG